MSNLKSSFSKFNREVEKSPLEISGMLGLSIGGERKVDVPGRNAFVYVRLRNTQNEVIQAFNNQVSPAFDLPVKVVREGNRYIVKGVDTERYQSNWASTSPYLPRHHTAHEFDIENGGGGDIVWVHSRQFLPMLSIPSGSSGAPNVVISPYTLRNLDGIWKYIGNTGTVNLTQYNPTGSYGVMVLVYIDASSGNPGIIVNSGSYFPATYTGTASLVPYFPTLPSNPNLMPDAAIRLVSGTLVIGWDNIYDARQFLAPIPTGSGGGGLSSIAVQDEGVAKGNATTFNFVGGRILASVAGSVATIGISPDPQDNIGFMTWLNGVPLGTGTILDVVGGSSLVALKSGNVISLIDLGITHINAGRAFAPVSSVTAIYFTGTGVQDVGFGTVNSEDAVIVNISAGGGSQPGQDQIGVFVQDEGIPLGTGTVLNFVGQNIDASISGSVVRVFVTGSAGGGIPSGTIQIYNSGTFVGSADKLDFQYPLAAGFTGTRAYPYLQGTLLAWEDVSAQMTGSNAHFTLTGTIALGTDRLFYNGIRQQGITHYTVDASRRGFQTLFTGSYADGDVLIMEYGNAGMGYPAYPMGVYDEGAYLGQAAGVDFIGDGVSTSLDVNHVARVQITGSGGGTGGDFVKIMDCLLTSDTGSFVFAGIPQTYTHLMIKASLRGVTGGYIQQDVQIFINEDTNSANYSQAAFKFYPSGTSTIGMAGDFIQNPNSNIVGAVPGIQASSGKFSSENWDIIDYTNTGKHKSIRRQASLFGNGALYGDTTMTDATVWWENNNAVLIIRIAANGISSASKFLSQSRATLYGLK